MTGHPAARITDAVANGKIVTGSRTVLIGSQGGVACSECPGGVAVGNPVNPSLGAKVLSGASDLDFALPGALPLMWQRHYSSYVNADHGGYCGMLGYGWSMPLELRLKVLADATLLHDSHGRTMTFAGLAAGQSVYSPSEDLWLLRAGGTLGGLGQDLGVLNGAARFVDDTIPLSATSTHPAQPPLWRSGRFAWISQDLSCSAHLMFAANGTGDVVWVFAPKNWDAIEMARKARSGHAPTLQDQSSAPDMELPVPSPDWILLGQLDRFGRMQRYRREDTLGQSRLVEIEDGVGRRYHLYYRQQHSGKGALYASSGHFWQSDDGVRLMGVDLVHDPMVPLSGQDSRQRQPLALVRYGYNKAGDLVSVHNQYGEQVRRFAWRNHLMILHQERRGPEHHYRYDRYEPGGVVIEQCNQEGLDYHFSYQRLPSVDGQPRKSCDVTDSLGRKETYLFQGEAGLSRLIEHMRADGSRIRRSYNHYGHLTSVTDPLNHQVRLQVDPQGRPTCVEGPDGIVSRQRWDDESGVLLSQVDAAGRSVNYTYDSLRRLVETTFSDGRTQRYTYPDPVQDRYNADKPIRITDPNGGVQQVAYTVTGQVSRHTDCTGSVTDYTYTRWGHIATMTNALGERIRHAYNGLGQLQAVYYPDDSADYFQYDPQGRLSELNAGRFADPRIPRSATSGQVQMVYDLWGRILKRSHAGHSLTFAYDAAGRLTRLSNENGDESRFIWDEMDRLIEETGFDGRVQGYTYDAAGHLVHSSDGDNRDHSEHCSHYEWTAGGQLAARHHGKSGASPTQSIRYHWGKTAELLSASVWQSREGSPPHLHSQILIERDDTGRSTGEVQRLYTLTTTSDTAPVLEFEHRIQHRLDALGNRMVSQLQHFGEIGYQRYGAGHVNGLTWQGHRHVEWERDAIHRESIRLLHGINSSGEHSADTLSPVRHLRWNALGRLTRMQWTGLSTPVLADLLDHPQTVANPACPPPVLVTHLTSRQYHYDSLGQMVGIETPLGLNQFGYDAAGRLMAVQSAQALTQHWRFDPAGNRLPDGVTAIGAKSATEPTAHLSATDRYRAEQRQREAERMSARPGQPHPDWMHPDYNLLQEGTEAATAPGLAGSNISCWRGNRVGYYRNGQDPLLHGVHLDYRYDSRGNRIEVRDAANSRRMQLVYDADNHLIQTMLTTDSAQSEQHYRYDAFGRRLAQYRRTGHETHVEYYGWDGDRLVHTERFLQGTQTREIIHTVYEPGAFTPLLQLSTTADADQCPGLVDEMINASGNELAENGLRPLRHNLGDTTQQILQRAHALGMDERAITHIEQQLQQVERIEHEAQAERLKGVTLRYYLCDHLGTPQALLSQTGTIDWAARLDPWGLLEEEYNPQNLYQPIRLPGQHADTGTGLYYNRHRYYDPQLGTYINQDPIGYLSGVLNLTVYVLNPLLLSDPLGLDWSALSYFQHPGYQAELNKAIMKQERFLEWSKTAKCPKSPPASTDTNWKPYVGNAKIFHCGYDGYLANFRPSPDLLMNECFYDENGNLVDENHPFSGCRGTPNAYPANDWFGHSVLDPGGIIRSGGPAFIESRWHDLKSLF